MGILIQIKAIFVTLLLVLFILVPTCLVAIPFDLKSRLKIVSPLWAFFGGTLLRYACQAKIVYSQDHRSLEFKGTPCSGLYIANHQSYLDIPLILTMFQAPPIMKKEVLYIPVFGQIGWICGALPVSRESSSSRRKVFESAKKRMLIDRIGLLVIR